MTQKYVDSFGTRKTLTVGEQSYDIFRLDERQFDVDGARVCIERPPRDSGHQPMMQANVPHFFV